MNRIKLTALILGGLALSVQCLGIGIIIPERIEPVHEIRNLALIRQDVDVKIKNDVARTHITQVFYNHYPRQLEATYIFPVPPDAHITDFVMYINGKPVRGEILEKNKARAIYENIVRQMKDPALLEYYDWQMFKMRIFPIPPEGKQKIEIEFVQVLKVDNDMVHFSFPVSKTDFRAVNIIDLKEWSFHISIDADSPIKTIYAPLHQIDVTMNNNNKSAEVTISPKDIERRSANIDLYYSYSRSEYGLNLLTYRPHPDEDGFFLLIISPGTIDKTRSVVPKDIVFIMDTSGSMAGEKIEQARDSLAYCLKNLNRRDRFNIIRFGTDVEPFSEEMLHVSDKTVDKALTFVDKMRARGGTNINEALETALKFARDASDRSSRLPVILFLTDGLPTVGVTNPDSILQNLEHHNRAGVHVFVFGVGYDVNTRLLDGIANMTHAVSSYIQPEENIEVKVSSLYDKISYPVMTGLELSFGDIGVTEMYPRDIPDLFAGGDISVLGKYKHAGHTAITLEGNEGEKGRRIVYECTFPEKERDNSFIEKIWATRKIGYLLDAVRRLDENEKEAKELVDEVVRLSKKYGIVTPYTSYLVQEDEVPEQGRRRPPLRFGQRALPEPTYAPSMESQILSRMKMDTGRAAVQQSIEIGSLKESLAVDKEDYGQNRVFIQGRQFELIDNTWIESNIQTEGKKIVTVKYLSPAYFELLSIRPDLAEFLKLGEKVRVQISPSVILEVADEGMESLTKETRSLIEKR